MVCPVNRLATLLAGAAPDGALTGLRRPRDRYIDLLRALSLSMVVLGHWLAVLVSWEDGTVTGRNALNVVPGMWPLTWVFQVMPLFFFVGGFSNRMSYESACRRGGGYVSYTVRRLQRLLVPTLVFLTIGVTTATILDVTGNLDALLRQAAVVVTIPLWFLGLYLLVIAVAPAMLALHRSFGAGVVITLAFCSVVVDLLRFTLDVEPIGFLNYGFVWLLVHQLGFLYADGRLSRLGAPLAVLGVGLLVGLVALGPYPSNLVGIESEKIDNMNPPTVAILAQAGWQVGVAMLVRRPVVRWLGRARVWRGVVALNQRIMTVFLWHMAAVLPTIAVVYPLGFPQPEPGSGAFWALRPSWVGLQLPVLACLVAAFDRFESVGRRLGADVRAEESGTGRVVAGLATLFVGLGIVGYARLGLEPPYSDVSKDVTVVDVNSARSLSHLVLGLFLLRAAANGEEAVRRAAFPAGFMAGLLALLGGLGVGLLSTTWPLTVLHAGGATVLVAVGLTGRRKDHRLWRRRSGALWPTDGAADCTDRTRKRRR